MNRAATSLVLAIAVREVRERHACESGWGFGEAQAESMSIILCTPQVRAWPYIIGSRFSRMKSR